MPRVATLLLMGITCWQAMIAAPVAAAEPLYRGESLAVWQERIKNLYPSSPEALAALPGLIEIVHDPQAPWFTRKEAALTLGRIGPRAAQTTVPELVRLLDAARGEGGGEFDAPRAWGAKGLALLGPAAAPATPRLIEILNDPRLPLAERQVMLEPLAVIGPAHPDVAPALAGLLQIPPDADGDARELREVALEALLVVGPGAEPALPLLIRLLRDGRNAVATRRRAAAAIGAMRGRGDIAAAPLAESIVADPSSEVREIAAESLGLIGVAALPTLAQLVQHRDPEVRRRAASAFVQLGPTGRAGLPLLQPLLADPSSDVQMAALEGMAAIEPASSRWPPLAVARLAADDRDIQRRAMKLLDRLSPAMLAQQRDPLAVLQDDARPAVRRSAERLLERIETQGAAASNR